MKRSTIFLLATATVLGICLAVYDFQLRAELRKGNYAKPLYRYTNVVAGRFDRVELRASSIANMHLRRGPFRVSIAPDAQDILVTRVEGSTLIVEAQFSDHRRGMNSDPTIDVSCPVLRSFRADAVYTVDSRVFVDGSADWFWTRSTTISGFEGDSLDIREENGSNVLLERLNYKNLSAVLGMKAGGWNAPTLTIGHNNQFNSSDLKILEHGRLQVTGPDIRQLNYHLGDSASLTITGAAARHLKID